MNINFENQCTKKYFIAGFTGIVDGIDFSALETALSYLTLVLSSAITSKQELLEIKMLEKLLPVMQKNHTEEYLGIISGSSYKYSEIFYKFKTNMLAD